MPLHKKKKKHTSVAKNANSMFNEPKTENKTLGCTQNVNVEVNIDQKDDCLTGCFQALIGAFKKGA